MTMAAILDVRDLTIIRDGTTILRGVAWRVEPGQHWVILGSNGSGKTSLLSALTGYLMPTRGSIEVLGRNSPKTPARATPVMAPKKSVGAKMPPQPPVP